MRTKSLSLIDRLADRLLHYALRDHRAERHERVQADCTEGDCLRTNAIVDAYYAAVRAGARVTEIKLGEPRVSLEEVMDDG